MSEPVQRSLLEFLPDESEEVTYPNGETVMVHSARVRVEAPEERLRASRERLLDRLEAEEEIPAPEYLRLMYETGLDDESHTYKKMYRELNFQLCKNALEAAIDRSNPLKIEPEQATRAELLLADIDRLWMRDLPTVVTRLKDLNLGVDTTRRNFKFVNVLVSKWIHLAEEMRRATGHRDTDRQVLWNLVHGVTNRVADAREKVWEDGRKVLRDLLKKPR